MEYDNDKVMIVIDFIDWLFEILGIFIINLSFFRHNFYLLIIISKKNKKNLSYKFLAINP